MHTHLLLLGTSCTALSDLIIGTHLLYSKQVKIEIERRKKLGIEHVERCRLVREKYKPLYPSVYQISVSTRMFS